MSVCSVCGNVAQSQPCAACTTSRTWWVIQTPHAVVWVPGKTIDAARASLRANTYDGAPVDDWPSVGCVQTTRHSLAMARS